MTQRMLTFTDASWEDYLYWQGQDKKTLRRINALIQATLRTPFEGVGKPEPLRAIFQDCGHAEPIRQTGWCMTYPKPE